MLCITENIPFDWASLKTEVSTENVHLIQHPQTSSTHCYKTSSHGDLTLGPAPSHDYDKSAQ